MSTAGNGHTHRPSQAIVCRISRAAIPGLVSKATASGMWTLARVSRHARVCSPRVSGK
ncbi:MAG: hypothetical protein JWN86_3369 [Planctomycetota bacterium]|nr:hypothetical protein [Planctomycetota bacterium]